MTLCIVWRDSPGFLSLASDSRLRLSDTVFVDIAPKIFPLEVTLFEETGIGADARVQRSPHMRLAACTAGSLASAQALRETLQLALYHLARVRGSQGPSIAALCTLIEHFYRNVVRSACDKLFARGQVEFVIAGFDPTTATTKAYHFALDAGSYPIRVRTKELADADFPFVFGSGSQAAEAHLAEDPSASPIHVLKKVILDDAVPSVGGPVQFTRVGPDGYVPFGTEDYSVDVTARRFRRQLFVAGVEVNPIELYEAGAPPMWLTYIAPFSDYLKSLVAQGFEEEGV